LRSTLVWDFTRRRMVVSYQHFGTTVRFHLQVVQEDGVQISLTKRQMPEITHRLTLAISQPTLQPSAVQTSRQTHIKVQFLSCMGAKLDTSYIHSFIHSVFCLTTGPKPPPKPFLHIVRSRASPFK